MFQRKIFFVISLLTGVAIFFMQCIGKKTSAGDDPRGNAYAGTTSCGGCHQDIMKSYIHTNHYKTSAATSYEDLKKFITPSNNRAYYADSAVVRLEEKQSRFYQSYLADGKLIRSEQIDIAIGSAEKAQTYAYWKNEQLVQLPLTFFTSIHSWTNSPGYPIRKPYFDRVILSRCFECHASFVEKKIIKSGPMQVSEQLAPASMIFGIDCERCHGPAAEHVAFQQENPTVKTARFITPVRSLTRQQKLDMCASCHSGNDLDVMRSLFAFRPGDTLANFYYPYFGSGGPKEPDVHGRQMQLLQSSKCFQQSTMTCTSCHNAHQTEENKIDLLVKNCETCHQDLKHKSAVTIASKTCVDCHMPLQASKLLDFNNGTERKSIPYLLRTHRIAIYPEVK